jgi:PAS domain S-box-containing protein
MSTPVRLLLVEDSESDAELIVLELRRHGYEVASERVDTAAALRAAMDSETWDLVICDHSLPGFGSDQALSIVRQTRPEPPFVILSGAIPEAEAVEAMKAGARDVVPKSNLSRLGPVVDRELSEASNRRRVREGIDELHDSEARMRAIVDSALDAVLTIDQTGAVLDFNPAAEAMFGRARSEVAGIPLADVLIPPSYRAAHRRGLEHFVTTGEAPILGQRLELSALRADGSEFPIELTVAHTRVGGTSLFTGSIRDLTERKSLEAQLRQAQRMEAVGELAGGIAHDFNNLLTVIRGYADVALASLPSDDVNRMPVTEIRQASDRAASLTAQLLAFGRRQLLRPELVTLNLLVDGAQGMIRRILPEDISIELHLATDPPVVEVDRGQFEQVMLNLAINARDAMPTGGVFTIETATVDLDSTSVAARPAVTPGRYHMLAITDTGFGMDAATQARIFEPFFTTKEVGEGTGLGLAMVYGTVKQSGGSIWVYSEPGRGTTIKIYLPIAEGQAGSAPVPPHLERELKLPSLSLLLVEDDPQLRRLITDALERAGCSVIAVESASEALAVIDKLEHLDLVISDVVMPGMNGLDLVRLLRERRPGLRALFMSGYASPVVEARGVDIAAERFLQKPFTLVQLASAVQETVGSSDET